MLIVSGALVGASGTLLTMMMGKAMNRSIGNVLFGAFGQVQAGRARRRGRGHGALGRPPRTSRSCSRTRSKVVVVPGYGMAVAQAQHAVRELADVLEKKGVEVTTRSIPSRGACRGT